MDSAAELRRRPAEGARILGTLGRNYIPPNFYQTIHIQQTNSFNGLHSTPPHARQDHQLGLALLSERGFWQHLVGPHNVLTQEAHRENLISFRHGRVQASHENCKYKNN